MNKIQTLLHKLYQDEEGATAVEYGVLVALIIAACVVIIQQIGTRVNIAFNKIAANLPTS